MYGRFLSLSITGGGGSLTLASMTWQDMPILKFLTLFVAFTTVIAAGLAVRNLIVMAHPPEPPGKPAAACGELCPDGAS